MSTLKIIIFSALSVFLCIIPWVCPVSAQDVVSQGDLFPKLAFPTPANPEHCAYLGVDPNADSFQITQIKARLVILEILNAYCSHCQDEAPTVNKLYSLIKKRGLQDQIKIFGSGAGNSEADLAAFQKNYQIPFPLVPDPDLKRSGPLGVHGTPHFIVIRLDSKDPGVVIYSEEGYLPELEDFLEEILASGGLK